MRLLCLLAIGVSSVWPWPLIAATPGDIACKAQAEASAEALVEGRYKTVGEHFSAAMAQQFPPAKIKQVWQSIQESAGEYQRRGPMQVRRFQEQTVFVTRLTFAKTPWDLLYACKDSDQITDSRLMPESQLQALFDAEKRAAAAHTPIQARTEDNGVQVKPLSVTSPYGPLRGALTLPAGDGPFPGVVLVGGSGPNDLNESVGGSAPFRDIADGLAAAGIASLRYDKRQTDYPRQVSDNAHLTIDDEQTDDAVTALDLLAQQPAVQSQQLFVLGHSQGAMLAPRIAKRASNVAGLILVAAPARPLLTVMQQQVREQGQRTGLPAAKIRASEKALAQEKKQLSQASRDNPLSGMFSGAPQSWWLSLHRYDQVAVAQSLKQPMLFLQGGSDFQVSPDNDFAKWKTALAGHAHVSFHLYPDLGHLMTPAGPTGTPADYKKTAHVATEVIDDMANWIHAQAAPDTH